MGCWSGSATSSFIELATPLLLIFGFGLGEIFDRLEPSSVVRPNLEKEVSRASCFFFFFGTTLVGSTQSGVLFNLRLSNRNPSTISLIVFPTLNLYLESNL